MRVLIIAATPKETSGIRCGPECTIVSSGVGPVNTAYVLTRCLANQKYDLVVNAGICGSYREELGIGTVVEIFEDIFGDLGSREPDGTFIDLKTMNLPLIGKDGLDLYNTLVNPTRLDECFSGIKLPRVRGITLNTTSGHDQGIRELKHRFNPDVESMEGAAAALVCYRENVRYLQIRSVSNRVEPRNRDNWRIDQAVTVLSNTLNSLIMEL